MQTLVQQDHQTPEVANSTDAVALNNSSPAFGAIASQTFMQAFLAVSIYKSFLVVGVLFQVLVS